MPDQARSEIREPGQLAGTGGLVRQGSTFAAIGVANTVLYILLFNMLLSSGVHSIWANAGALIATVGLGFHLNRRLTFQRVGRGGIGRELVRFVVIYAGTASVSGLALTVLHAVQPGPDRRWENVVGVGSNMGLLVVRFMLLQWWVFRRPTERNAEHQANAVDRRPSMK